MHPGAQHSADDFDERLLQSGRPRDLDHEKNAQEVPFSIVEQQFRQKQTVR